MLQAALTAQELPVTGIRLVSSTAVQPSSAGSQTCQYGSVSGTCISASLLCVHGLNTSMLQACSLLHGRKLQ